MEQAPGVCSSNTTRPLIVRIFSSTCPCVSRSSFTACGCGQLGPISLRRIRMRLQWPCVCCFIPSRYPEIGAFICSLTLCEFHFSGSCLKQRKFLVEAQRALASLENTHGMPCHQDVLFRPVRVISFGTTQVRLLQLCAADSVTSRCLREAIDPLSRHLSFSNLLLNSL